MRSPFCAAMASRFAVVVCTLGFIQTQAARTNFVADAKAVLNQQANSMECQDVVLPDGDDARIKLGGIANMDSLINNNNVMVYAWGPAFAGQGQIFAWAY